MSDTIDGAGITASAAVPAAAVPAAVRAPLSVSAKVAIGVVAGALGGLLLAGALFTLPRLVFGALGGLRPGPQAMMQRGYATVGQDGGYGYGMMGRRIAAPGADGSLSCPNAGARGGRWGGSAMPCDPDGDGVPDGPYPQSAPQR